MQLKGRWGHGAASPEQQHSLSLVSMRTNTPDPYNYFRCCMQTMESRVLNQDTRENEVAGRMVEAGLLDSFCALCMTAKLLRCESGKKRKHACNAEQPAAP